MTPRGKPGSLLGTLSILIFTSLSFKIFLTSVPFTAYLSLYLNKTNSGKDSLSLYGP